MGPLGVRVALVTFLTCKASLCEAYLLFSLKVGPSSWVRKG